MTRHLSLNGNSNPDYNDIQLKDGGIQLFSRIRSSIYTAAKQESRRNLFIKSIVTRCNVELLNCMVFLRVERVIPAVS